MSGHSKWSQIKRKKEATDIKKGQIFTKLAANISLAIKEGGTSDPKQNFKLRLALEKAKEANMPKGSVERAIAKGLGKEGEEGFEEIIYEAYGPGGVALLIETSVANKNRASADIRSILERNNARLAEAGSVKWMFKKIGIIETKNPEDETEREKIELFAIDKGAENIETEKNKLKIITLPQNLEAIKKEIANQIPIEQSYLSWIPENKISVDEATKNYLMKLTDEFGKNENITAVYHNAT